MFIFLLLNKKIVNCIDFLLSSSGVHFDLQFKVQHSYDRNFCIYEISC